tara:strand:+ start:180 stop:296 length:117 start_codon:yes stop_codon:yes gene_type:complete
MRWESGSYKDPNLENLSKLTHPFDLTFSLVIFCKLGLK